MRFFCKFGKNLRFVLLLAWETRLPETGPFPVSSQTFAIFFYNWTAKVAEKLCVPNLTSKKVELFFLSTVFFFSPRAMTASASTATTSA